jgi:molybdenum cofactor cytidylyltransferase
VADETFAAIVLAGGLSRRMGEVNKLHLPVQGVPMLRHSVEALLAADIKEVVVVLGHEYNNTVPLLSDLPIRIAYNREFATGQMSSVHCGLSSLTSEHQGVFVALADQPALQAHHFILLRNAFLNRTQGDVAVPFFRGERGNPIVVSAACRQSILAGERNLGCRRFIDNNPEQIVRVHMPDDAVLRDLDTPAEYQSFIATGA